MESFNRQKIKDINENIKFQVLSWEKFDEEINDGEEEYKIYMFGVTNKEESISVKINNYTPYFYVKVPLELQDKWKDFHTKELKNFICKKLYSLRDSLLKISLVEKKDISFFTNEKQYKFIKIILKNEKSFKKCKYILVPGANRPKPVIPTISPLDLNFEIYEANIEPFIRFCHITNIKTAGWCELSKYKEEDNSRCQIDISCKWTDIKPIENCTDICKMTIASYDIECISQRAKEHQKNIFPDYSLEHDYITQIGVTFHKFGTNLTTEYMCTLKSPIDNKVNPVDGIIIEEFDNETELIKGFINLIRKTDPDIITGYNINGFDWNYIHERVKLLRLDLIVGRLSRLHDYPAYFKEDKLVTNAYGENTFKYYHCYGILNSDLFTIVKREQKLISYKLDFVAETHIGQQKDPLTPLDIFNKALGTAEEVATVIHYCAKDCTLVLRLIKKLCIITNLIGMANVTLVPIEYIENRGQQIKVHSQLLYESRLNNYLVPTLPYKANNENDDDEKFTGATVLDAEQAAHFEQISGLDFASLYPSIMIAGNYSYETMVKKEEFDNLEGIEYKDIKWTEDLGKETEREECVRFVQNRKGILPIMLEKLWTQRKAIKKEMKVIKKQINESNNEEEKEELQSLYNVKDGFQLAMKVSMNSIYGFTGAKLGRLPEKRIAAAVTATGRGMIKDCKAHVEETYDCKVVYGDSVTSYTPIEVRINKNRIYYLKIEDLIKDNNSWYKCLQEGKQDKDYCSLHGYEIWTENGWTNINTIIKHKLNSSKKIIRITTLTGIVDVTDDHSLILQNGDIISPKDIEIGMTLLSSKRFFPDIRRKDESLKIYCNTQLEAAIRFRRAQRLGYNVNIKYENNMYIITNINPINSSQMINIEEIEYSGVVYDLTTEDSHFCAGIGNLVVHNTDSIYVKFFTNYTGQEHMNEVFRLSEVAAESCSKLFKKPIDLEFEKVMWPFILFSKKRYACVIWTNEHKHDYIDYKGIQVVRRDNCPLIKEKSKRIFETILLDRNIPKSIEMAREYIVNLLEGNYPIKELIISKSLKGYGSYEFDKQIICKECGKKWYTEQLEKDKVKKVYRIPMNDKKTLSENIRIFISEDQYCFSCKKKTEFRGNIANIAHVALARKMEARDPYNCPVPGERVPYVFKKVNTKNPRQFEMVEDPEYLIQNCIPIDYNYYFEHQLKSALDTIFEPILKDKLTETLYSGIIKEKEKKKSK